MADPAEIPEPPTAPAGYAVLGLEVRGESRVVLAGPPDGWQRAVILYRRHAAGGATLAAVAWWEGCLDRCVSGRERLVSRFDPAAWSWSPWAAEERSAPQSRRRTRPHGTGLMPEAEDRL